jgi:hypothetical protein
MSLIDAWASALSFALQIYFDFSAYCDMAIGISLIFGVKLPINFFSPYKAANIIQFWRTWHMGTSNYDPFGACFAHRCGSRTDLENDLPLMRLSFARLPRPFAALRADSGL